MKNKNTNIINEVKKYINNNLQDESDFEDKLNNQDIVEELISDKAKTLDKLIDKEIRNWINLNAEKIAKEIISKNIKKLFK